MDYSVYKQIDFRRKFLKLVGAEIDLIDPQSGSLIGVIKMKAWKLREDIRLYQDRTVQHEIMRISARQIIDFGATYDVFDSATNQIVFSLRRKGLKSTFVRDHWDLIDTSGAIYGSLQETSSMLALARRWLELLPLGDFIALFFAFVAQTYVISLTDASGNSASIGTIVHSRNPILVRMLLDTSSAQTKADPRICVAAVALLSVVDASKNS